MLSRLWWRHRRVAPKHRHTNEGSDETQLRWGRRPMRHEGDILPHPLGVMGRGSSRSQCPCARAVASVEDRTGCLREDPAWIADAWQAFLLTW